MAEFTLSSSPARKDTIDLTIKRNPGGQVTNYLFQSVETGHALRLKGAQGGFYFDPTLHPEPLVLVSAGSGITPMMSITRFLIDAGEQRSCWFLHGARTPADIIFHDECRRLTEEHDWFHYHVTLSQPGEGWTGCCGRIDLAQVTELIDRPADCRYFLCGPNAFMDELRSGLHGLGVPAERIHTEQFHASPQPVAL